MHRFDDNQAILIKQEEQLNEEPKLDLKTFRLKATDFFMSPVLQNLLAKVLLYCFNIYSNGTLC